MYRLLMVFVLVVGISAVGQTAAAKAGVQSGAKAAQGAAGAKAQGAMAKGGGEKAAVMAVIKQFEHDFNAGDPGWMKLCADPAAIIDEFPPYAWTGSNACKQWSDDYDADAKKNGVTKPSVMFGRPRHLEVMGDRAYVVLPSEYDYTQNGKAVKETGASITIALQKAGRDWKVSAWTWAKGSGA